MLFFLAKYPGWSYFSKGEQNKLALWTHQTKMASQKLPQFIYQEFRMLYLLSLKTVGIACKGRRRQKLK